MVQTPGLSFDNECEHSLSFSQTYPASKEVPNVVAVLTMELRLLMLTDT